MTNTSSLSPNTSNTAKILDGGLAAKAVIEGLHEKIKGYLDSGKRPPALAVILVGNDPASEVYVKNKIATCKKIGIESQLRRYSSDASRDEIVNCIEEFNADDTIDGILLQLPLPSHLPTNEILDIISPHKDVDGLHPYNLGLLFAGVEGLQPCTPKGIINLLQFYQIPIKGKYAVVVGRSNLVGKPVAGLLLKQHATVTICHSRTENLPDICRQADILVVAAGKPEMVRTKWIKPGACVIDVGIHRTGDAKLVGDVCFDEAKAIASYITPVPGGVGKMTVAMLMDNTVSAYKKHIEM
jgi:methylenetetrahydrofolate dehydrogenase (NADP+) / methenyltetrahydrofolate cyclohydrolase